MGATLEIQGKSLEYDIRALAGQFALPMPHAQALLRDEIDHLERMARIRDFILILALKTVKDHLRSSPDDLTYGLA